MSLILTVWHFLRLSLTGPVHCTEPRISEGGEAGTAPLPLHSTVVYITVTQSLKPTSKVMQREFSGLHLPLPADGKLGFMAN